MYNENAFTSYKDESYVRKRSIKSKRQTTPSHRSAFRDTFLGKIKCKILLTGIISSKAKACVFFDAYDSITQDKSVHYVL